MNTPALLFVIMGVLYTFLFVGYIIANAIRTSGMNGKWDYSIGPALIFNGIVVGSAGLANRYL